MFNCYPSRVRHTYIVHASGTMYASVKAILAMMRPVTRAKVTFVSDDLSELHAAIDPKLLPPEMGGVDGYGVWHTQPRLPFPVNIEDLHRTRAMP